MSDQTGERSWKLAAKALDARDWWMKRIEAPKDSEGKPIARPYHKFRVKIDYGFGITLEGTVSREFKRGEGIDVFSRADREALTAWGTKWVEPSELFDAIVTDFKHELEMAMRDAMPWDGEF
jgi:hypothetical protein